jgi:hypothetical protein
MKRIYYALIAGIIFFFGFSFLGRTSGVESPLSRQWTQFFPTDMVSDIALDPNQFGLVYVVSNSQLFRTTDNGKTWSDSLNFDLGVITWLEIDHNNPSSLYINVLGQGVYKSNNMGDDWALLNSKELTHPDIDPQNSNIWYILDKKRSLLYKSLDSGLTFKTIKNGLPETSWDAPIFAIHPMNSSILYLFAGTYSNPTNGLYRSADGGENWEKLNYGLPWYAQGLDNISFDPNNPAAVYLTRYDPGGMVNYVLMSTDYGNNWKTLFTTPGWGIIPFFSPSKNFLNTAYVCIDNSGLYVTSNNYQMLRIISDGLPNQLINCSSVSVRFTQQDHFYAITSGHYAYYLLSEGLFNVIGSIKDKQGTPWKDYPVFMDERSIVRTDNKGVFWFQDIPAGDYILRPGEKFGYSFTPPVREVSVLDSDQSNEEFIAYLTPYTITGQIVNRHGEGIAGVQISNQNSTKVNSGLNGEFALPNHTLGFYTFTLTGTNNTFPRARIHVPYQTTDLKFVGSPLDPPDIVNAYSGPLSTRLEWSPSTNPQFIGYNLYGKKPDGSLIQLNDTLIQNNVWNSDSISSPENSYQEFQVTTISYQGQNSYPSKPVTAHYGQTTLSVPDISGATGELIRIPVTISNNGLTRLYHFNAEISYPTSTMSIFNVDGRSNSFTLRASEPGRIQIESIDENRNFLRGRGIFFEMLGRPTGEPGSTSIIRIDSSTISMSVDKNGSPVMVTDFVTRDGTITAQPEFSRGDVNGDTKLTDADADLALQFASGAGSSPTNKQIAAGDINGDGNITAADALLIQRIVDNSYLQELSRQDAMADWIDIKSNIDGNIAQQGISFCYTWTLSIPNQYLLPIGRDSTLPIFLYRR